MKGIGLESTGGRELREPQAFISLAFKPKQPKMLPLEITEEGQNFGPGEPASCTCVQGPEKWCGAQVLQRARVQCWRLPAHYPPVRLNKPRGDT